MGQQKSNPGGRSQIIKTFVISQFLFVSSIIETPLEVIKSVNNLIFKFMWKNKQDRLKRCVLQKQTDNGGLNVPDFETMINASKLKWIKNMCKNYEPPWKLILQHYLEPSGIHLNILLHSNYSLKYLNICKGSLPGFYYSLLELWSKYGNTMPVDKQEFIWYNKQLCVNGKSVYYKDFHKAGAWYIKDLYQSGGTPVPFNVWVSRGVRPQYLIKWMGLIKKTKSLWTRSSLSPSEEPTQLVLTNKGQIRQLNSKIIYSELLGQKIGFDACVPRIAKYLQNSDTILWSNVYRRANKVPLDTKTKEFQYKFLHDLLANNYWLHKWKIKQSNICHLCDNEVDTIEHMFWSCEATQRFWVDVSTFCNTNLYEMTIDKTSVLLGTDEPVLCNIIFMAKIYLYNKIIHEERMVFQQFLMYMNMRKKIEFQIVIVIESEQ